MKKLAQLFAALDNTNSTNDKVELLKNYFAEATDHDKMWALALFTGRRPKRKITASQMKLWAAEVAIIPSWLFEESYNAIGDLGETISLLVSKNYERQEKSLTEWFNGILNLADNDESKKEFVLNAWNTLPQNELLVFNKLLMGSLRLGVSQTLVVRAIAEITNFPTGTILHRIMGDWNPQTTSWQQLIFTGSDENISAPYPFYLAYPLEHEAEQIGSIHDWYAEWKWDGIRSQAIKRKGKLYIWSRGEELVTEKFPELDSLKDQLPDGIALDGEIVGLDITSAHINPLPFTILQTRISRKNVTKKILENAPCGLILYDLLEYDGKDIRNTPHIDRRILLENVFEKLNDKQHIRLSPILTAENWSALKTLQQNARNVLAEGLMLKRKNAQYLSGRKKGDWWKWKVGPLTADAVLVYAQKGHGKRAELYTDYTFALWHEGKLVTFAKAYSGLTDKEIVEVDKFIKANTLEKFGPVRTVKPQLVFELGFEGIQESSRHKSGIAVRFPRILRWRKDKPVEQADTLSQVKDFLSTTE